MSTENSNYIDISDCARFNTETGELAVYDPDSEATTFYQAHELAPLLEVLVQHEDLLRSAVRAQQAQSRWDEVHRIVRDLVGQGVNLHEVTQDWQRGAGPDALLIRLYSDVDVRAHAAGVEVTETVEHGMVYTRAELVPGVTIETRRQVETSAA